MYLLTFVTLLIGLIGIYSQVVAVQTARIAAQQSGIASAMLTWQTAATSMARSIIATNTTAYTGTECSLTYTMPTGITRCPSPQNGGADINLATAGGGTITSGTNAPNLVYYPAPSSSPTPNYNVCVNLPSHCSAPSPLPAATSCTACAAEYDTVNYQFSSVLYKSGNQNYVITFVPPPTITASNPLPGFITPLPGGTPLSATMGDLMQQLKNTSAPHYSYGHIVDNGVTVTLNATGLTYTLPTSFSGLNLNGGIAIIGTP